MATPYPNIQHDLPPIIAQAISSQKQIRWNQLYQGRFSQHWAQAINHLHPSLALAGHQIITIIIQAIWKYVIATWTVCNTHLHNNNDTMNLPDYRNAVQAMYEQRHQLPPETQEALFSRPIDTLLQQSPEFLRRWIIQSNQYIKQQLHAAKNVLSSIPWIYAHFSNCVIL